MNLFIALCYAFGPPGFLWMGAVCVMNLVVALQEPTSERHPFAQLRHGRAVRAPGPACRRCAAPPARLCELRSLGLGRQAGSAAHAVAVRNALPPPPHDRAGCACRGRKDRLAFAASFTPAYHFRLLYMSSQMAYPIMGALRHCFDAPWEVRSPGPTKFRGQVSWPISKQHACCACGRWYKWVISVLQKQQAQKLAFQARKHACECMSSGTVVGEHK